ncbi:hypothetical protein SD81_006215 [Tolypothrix campylonemoides VB511288]|nr:hypothetical protein SD81_006215 [Tolypothrix campylonemoides VB511288]
MKINFQPIRAIVAIVPFALLLNSCGRDFPSVQKLGKMTTKLEESSSIMANDIYDSCITKTKYISFLSTSKPSQISPDPFFLKEQHQKYCDDSKKPIVISVKAANTLVINYIQSLGKLATGDTVSFDKNLNSLADSLKNLKGKGFSVNGSDVDAGIGIARFLLNAATREFRREKIKQAVLCIDKDIQTYIGQVSTPSGKESVSDQPETAGLIALTQKAYINGTLKEEEEQIKTYFSTYIAAMTRPQTHPVDFLKLDEDYNKAINSLRNRREAAQNYIKILTQIAEMHAELKENFQGKGKDRLSDAQLQDYCQNIYTQKAEKVAKEKAAISNDKDIQNVGKIVSEYTKNIDTLIQDMDKNL